MKKIIQEFGDAPNSTPSKEDMERAKKMLESSQRLEALVRKMRERRQLNNENK